MMEMIEELHKFDRCVATELAKIPSVSVHFAWRVQMLLLCYFGKTFSVVVIPKQFSTKLNGFFKICCFEMTHSRSINE